MNREEAKASGKGTHETHACVCISKQAVLDVIEREQFKGDAISEIEKLPSVNPQPCEDAISRQAALGCCRNEWEEEVEIRLKSLPSVTPQQSCEDIAKAFQLGMALGFAKKHDEMDKVMEEVKKAVTSQPKTGHWINLGVQGEIDGQIVKGFTCSKCGAISVFRMTGRKIVNGDLCPNCGAKMSES